MAGDGLTEASVHAANEVARLVRTAAYSAVRTPGWGNSLVLGLALEEGMPNKRVVCALAPVRSGPDSELVRVHFDPPGTMAHAGDLVAAILEELTPSIVGVGQIRTEKGLEGFKVFAVDDRNPRLSHDTSPLVRSTDNSSTEITPEMIEAGEDVILCEVGGADLGYFSASDLAYRVFRAMERTRPVAPDSPAA